MTSTNSAPISVPAHDPGYTYLAFSRDGVYTYTGGSDTLTRIWRVSEGTSQDPPFASEPDGAITTLAATTKYWLSGSADGHVRCYNLGTAEMTALITSVVGASVRSLATDPSGKRVAVASDEQTVKLIDIDQPTNIAVLAGHSKGVRRVTWHPSGSYVTVSGADGNVTVWDVSEDDPKLVEVVRGIIPAVHDINSHEFSHDCSAVWHPSGEYFLVATRAHSVVAIARSNWTTSFTLSDDQQMGDITALALSANGVYLATAAQSGVFIWSTQTRRVLIRLPPQPSAGSITQIAWSPTANILAWVDSNGTFIHHRDIVPKSFADPVKSSNSAAMIPRTKPRAATPLLFDDIPGADAPNDDLDVDMNPDDDGLHDFLDDDLGDFLKDDGGEKQFRSGQVEVVNITKAQAAFQPGSTPMDAGKRKRLLAYNMIGYIEVTDQDTHHVVDVKMHDVSPESPRKGYHFTDNFKYNMAVLGERGVAFACSPEAGHRAHVAFKPYASWDTGSRATEDEWTYELPPGVTVLGLAVGGRPMPQSRRAWTRDLEGKGHVIIATSENELTFITGTGIERYSMGLDGDFVSMVAGPEWVFIVHRDGATTIDGSQNLKGSLITLDDYCVLQERRLPIPKNQTLRWIGVTEEGAPTIYDSNGVLHMMPRFRIPLRATWARILDTNKLERREGKDESYWPFAVTGETFRCLVLKGRQEHPPFPVPYPQELELRLPFRKTDAEEAPLEEKLARRSMFLDIARDALGDELTTQDIGTRETELDIEIIKLLGKACSSNVDRPTRQARALDLVRMIHNPAIFPSAIKLAQFYKLRGLEDRINQLKDLREEEDRQHTARDRRREWAGDVAAVPPPRNLVQTITNVSGARAFGDFAPPPASSRPGLARAKPSTAQPFTTSSTHQSPSTSTWDLHDDEDGPPALDGEPKRKRTPQDELGSTEAKRRAVAPVAALKHNPFARKAPAETVRDPFNRQEDQKTVRKSDSFFNKVEAAENGAGRSGGKGKGKEVGRQTTLFGHAVRTSGAPKIQAPAKGKTGIPPASEKPQRDLSGDDTQETQVVESQIDSEMATEAISGATTVLADEDEEPMEWPDSPTASSVPLEAE